MASTFLNLYNKFDILFRKKICICFFRILFRASNQILLDRFRTNNFLSHSRLGEAPFIQFIDIVQLLLNFDSALHGPNSIYIFLHFFILLLLLNLKCIIGASELLCD
jgi:hypothetical protein